jgi:hypothetical protein
VANQQSAKMFNFFKNKKFESAENFHPNGYLDPFQMFAFHRTAK